MSWGSLWYVNETGTGTGVRIIAKQSTINRSVKSGTINRTIRQGAANGS